MPPLPVVKVGVIGIGADWQSRYLPSLQNMNQRLRVVAVHDDVAIRAIAAAELLNALPVLGIRDLLQRTDIRGFLYLGTHWRTEWLTHQLAQCGLPTFVGRDIKPTDEQIRSWHVQSDEFGITVVPEFPLRFSPAMLRLRELMATQLGPVLSLNTFVPPTESDAWPMTSLTHVLDCCSSLLNRQLTKVEPVDRDVSPGPTELRLSYVKRTGSRSDHVSVKLTFLDLFNSAHEPRQDFLMEVTCKQGTATIHGPREIRWTCNGVSKIESLHTDRSSTEVMLDLFARRAIGGLIPTPDLNDLLQASADADVVRDSLPARFFAPQ